MAQVKLSKAQQTELDKMRAQYNATLAEELEYYTKGLEKATTDFQKEYNKASLEMVNKGFILWYSFNSKTLEKLASLGYIEYVKKENRRFGSPIDWIKLL